MDEHAPDPLAPVDDWLDDERMTAALHVIDNGAPASEAERTVLALAIGEELGMLTVAASQVRLAVDVWHSTRRPIAEFKNGVLELRGEEAEIVKARSVYNRALGIVKMRVERKQARGRVLDVLLAIYNARVVDLPAELEQAVEDYVALTPAAPVQRERRKVAA